MEKLPEGFSVPIHRSLTTPIMIGGLPRKIAILNGTVIIAFVVGAHNLWILPLGIFTHLILAVLHRRDAQILQVIKRNINRPPSLRS
jgi:type IV secretion system protein VirB3